VGKSLDSFDNEATLLLSVAQLYDADSPERAALRRAALALMYVSLDHPEEFDEFVREADRDATADADAYLARLRAKRK